MKATINGKPCNVNLVEEVDIIDPPYWAIYTCEVEFDDGTFAEGCIQSDGHMCADDTFEEE